VAEAVVGSHLERREAEREALEKEVEALGRNSAPLPDTEVGQNGEDRLRIAGSTLLTTRQSVAFLKPGLAQISRALANGQNDHHVQVCNAFCGPRVSAFSLIEGAMKLGIPASAMPCGECKKAQAALTAYSRTREKKVA